VPLCIRVYIKHDDITISAEYSNKYLKQQSYGSNFGCFQNKNEIIKPTTIKKHERKKTGKISSHLLIYVSISTSTRFAVRGLRLLDSKDEQQPNKKFYNK